MTVPTEAPQRPQGVEGIVHTALFDEQLEREVSQSAGQYTGCPVDATPPGQRPVLNQEDSQAIGAHNIGGKVEPTIIGEVKRDLRSRVRDAAHLIGSFLGQLVGGHSTGRVAPGGELTGTRVKRLEQMSQTKPQQKSGEVMEI